MEDRELMEEELLIIKGVSDLYLHGAIESSTKEVHDAFKSALCETLDIQNKIYNLMSEKGWYCTIPASNADIVCVENKFKQ